MEWAALQVTNECIFCLRAFSYSRAPARRPVLKNVMEPSLTISHPSRVGRAWVPSGGRSLCTWRFGYTCSRGVWPLPYMVYGGVPDILTVVCSDSCTWEMGCSLPWGHSLPCRGWGVLMIHAYVLFQFSCFQDVKEGYSFHHSREDIQINNHWFTQATGYMLNL